MQTEYIGYIPNVSEILKLVEKIAYRFDAHTFLSDVFECSAIAISNRFDYVQYKAREARYLQIVKKYDKDAQSLIVDIATRIYLLLSRQIYTNVGFNDYLGELYMKSNTSNSSAGQFFTPYDVSKLSARLSVDENVVKQYMEQDRILTLNEPSCGSGGMIIATAEVLYREYNFNIARNLLIECSDIDKRIKKNWNVFRRTISRNV